MLCSTHVCMHVCMYVKYIFVCIPHRDVYHTLSGMLVVVVVVVVFTLKTVLTSIQYPSLFYSSRQRNEFPWSQANPK